jgi:NAD-dependent DNA ligase
MSVKLMRMMIHVMIGQAMSMPYPDIKPTGTQMIDKIMREVTEKNMNMTVPWYLMTSYAYYVEDNPLVSDGAFDRLAKTMIKNWDKIEHFHKDHIKVDDLKAGTFLGEYPSRVPDAVKDIRHQAVT